MSNTPYWTWNRPVGEEYADKVFSLPQNVYRRVKYFIPSIYHRHLIRLDQVQLDLHYSVHHHLQGLGILALSDLPFRRIDPYISLMVSVCLFFLLGGNWVFSKGFGGLTFFGYVWNNSAGIPLFSLLDCTFLNFAWYLYFSFLSTVACHLSQESHFRGFDLLELLFS
jgi:hypothetical protein